MSGSLAASRTHSPSEIEVILDQLAAHERADEVVTAVHRVPARGPQWAPMPEWVRTELVVAYRDKGVEQLYSHQAQAIAAIHDRRNAVIVTPTASGKTLCYNLPVLNSVLEAPDTRALYLFPTKALAQDQLAELYGLGETLGNQFGVFTYDGDTPSDARAAIRDRGHIVLTNPDMLHAGILPHHTRWTVCLRTCATSYSTSYTLTVALLLELADRLKKRPVLVTFNGKSFDWPLLQSRFRMTRQIEVPEIGCASQFFASCPTALASADRLNQTRRFRADRVRQRDFGVVTLARR